MNDQRNDGYEVLHETASLGGKPPGWPPAGRSTLAWSEVIELLGRPVESSILTSQQWRDALAERRVATIRVNETGSAFCGSSTVESGVDVVCRVAFDRPLPPDVTFQDVQLASIDRDFAAAVRRIEEINQQLWNAVCQGDLAQLRAAIQAGADANAGEPGRGSKTPLRAAIQNRDPECVRLLLESGADLGTDGAELWRQAARNADHAITQILEEYGVQPRPLEPTQETDLMTAISKGKAPAVQALLESGTDVNQASERVFEYGLAGWTPLTLAIDVQNRAIVDIVLARGADVRQATALGITPWAVAAATNQNDLCQELEARGATVDLQTALIFATLRGDRKSVENLLVRGADPLAATWFGTTSLKPLQAAVASDDYLPSGLRGGHTALARLFLERGADPNSRLSDGTPVLLRAAARGQGELVTALIAHGGNVNTVDSAGDSALIKAAANKEPDCTAQLLKAGADPNVQNLAGETALTALLTGTCEPSSEAVKWLIAFGAHTDVCTRLGCSVPQLVNRGVRRAENSFMCSSHFEAIKQLLDDQETCQEFAGVFAHEPETLADCYRQALCARSFLDDVELLTDSIQRSGTFDTAVLPVLMAGIISELRTDTWVPYLAFHKLGEIDASDVRSVSKLIDCLYSADEGVWKAAQGALLKLRERAVPDLLTAIENAPVPVALRAALVASWFENDRLLQAIVSRLPPDESILRGQAALDAGAIYRLLALRAWHAADFESVVRYGKPAVSLDPSTADGCWLELAVSQEQQGDDSLTRAITAHRKGCAHAEQGEFEAEKAAHLEAIAADPSYPWSYDNLAWLLMDCPDTRHRDSLAAVDYAREASRLTGNRYYQILGTLAATYAATADFTSAVETARQALDVAPAAARMEYQFDVERYRAQLPWCPYTPSRNVEGTACSLTTRTPTDEPDLE